MSLLGCIPAAMDRRLALPIAEAMVRSASSCVVPYDSKAPVAPAVHTDVFAVCAVELPKLCSTTD
jgi:hypothetical protein